MEEQVHFEVVNLYWDFYEELVYEDEPKEKVCENDYNLRSKGLPTSITASENTPLPQKDTSLTFTPPPPPKSSAPTIIPPPKKSTNRPKTSSPKNGKSKVTTATRVYRPNVASLNYSTPKAVSPTNTLQIVIGSGSNGSNIASTSAGGSKASNLSSTSPRDTPLGTTGNKNVNKGKKVSTHEIVGIDCIVVEDMKKAKENISIF